MSMVLFASVVRVGDGLPLSASTDYEQDKELQETKRHLKGLSKKLSQFPDRCTLKSGPYNVNFTSSLGVGYLMVCTANYPNVLAFCFLDELQKEFIVTYDTKRIRSVVRPYSFIEFDTFIQKTKQRYNSPRSLSTKINLADMQTEIKLRPPYQLSPEDLRAINGFSVHTPSKYKGIAPTQILEPVTLPGIVSCVLSVLCGGLNLLRGVHAIESILQNDDEDFNYVIAFFLGTAACLYQMSPHNTDTYLQLPEEVQSGRGLHLLGVKVEGKNEDGDDHRGHDLQRNLGVHHTAGVFQSVDSRWHSDDLDEADEEKNEGGAGHVGPEP